MNPTSTWRNRNLNRNGGLRIDLRPHPATAAGMRGVHRDMRGNVIGGYTAEGQPLGTKNRGFHRYGRRLPVSSYAGSARTAAPKSPGYRLWQIPGTNQTRVIMDPPSGRGAHDFTRSDVRPGKQKPADAKDAKGQPPGSGSDDETTGIADHLGRATEATWKAFRGLGSKLAGPFTKKPAGDPAEAAAPEGAGTSSASSAPKRSINKLTGMPFGVAPGDAAYNPHWRDAADAVRLATKAVGKV